LEEVRSNGPRPHPPLPILTTDYDRRGGIKGREKRGWGTKEEC
jgi:hypothetical protein